MSNLVKNISTTTLDRLRCGFWLLMLLTHAPALLRIATYLPSGRAGELHAAGSIALILACIFFILKIIDVKCVRFKTDRRSVCALALAVALMHVSMLRYVNENIPDRPQTLFLANALAASTVASVRRILKRVVRWVGRLLALPKPASFLRALADQCPNDLSPQRLAVVLAAPRAPPCLCSHRR